MEWQIGIVIIAVWVGMIIGSREKITFDFGQLCFWAFVWSLFSFTLNGLLLAIAILIGALIYSRILDAREKAIREEELKIRETRRNTIMELSVKRQSLRSVRKTEAMLNKAKKLKTRLPKSSQNKRETVAELIRTEQHKGQSNAEH